MCHDRSSPPLSLPCLLIGHVVCDMSNILPDDLTHTYRGGKCELSKAVFQKLELALVVLSSIGNTVGLSLKVYSNTHYFTSLMHFAQIFYLHVREQILYVGL